MSNTRRIDQDTYAVIHGGLVIGHVAKGWTRAQGNGWYARPLDPRNPQERVTGRRFPTLKAATNWLLTR